MYRLKEDVKIVLRRHGIVVTKKGLEQNQNLATLILEDPIYSAKYGHLIEDVGANGKPTKPNITPRIGQDAFTIEVNVKKKPVTESQASPDTASALTETPKDGNSLIVNAPKQESKSTGSGLLKQVKQNTDSKKKK